MKRREIKKRKNSGAPKWMVTYSDMVTLILVFFILLFSMSQIDLVKFEAISESFQNRMILDFYPSAVPAENPTEHPSIEERGKDTNEFETPSESRDIKDRDESKEVDKDNQDSLSSLLEEVEAYLDENNLNNVITANRTEQGVVLVLQESILFDSAEAEILDSGMPFLDRIGSLLHDIPNSVKVEGHTDSRPISNFRYPSNWELSGARASSVIRYLIEENEFDESRFSAAGYADTRPAVPNDSPQNWSQNRRVEIVILEDSEE
jgi:chemotaxis protein MotB